MRPIDVSAGRLVNALVTQANGRRLALLDSCGVGKPGSNRLIAGVDPVEVLEVREKDPNRSLELLNARLTDEHRAAIFTISYDLGARIIGLDREIDAEPDIFIALFDGLIVHDYDSDTTSTVGRAEVFEDLCLSSEQWVNNAGTLLEQPQKTALVDSNFSRSEYLAAVEEIRELIRCGDTYQTNLTQRLTVPINEDRNAVSAFKHLRAHHPAPYAAFIDRGDSIVVSASPEQFIKVEVIDGGRLVSSSPIKGTRPRGIDKLADAALRAELLASEKDRAENKMIVDLMRNDLGQICDFGSVSVTELCRIEPHPTLFHLVSSVQGRMGPEITYADLLRSVFPCGSITGAPKIRTMQLIDRLEPDPRGLSMGAIGYRLPAGMYGGSEMFEMSVAIRTMVAKDGTAVFNVGGGIVIDSDPETEYEESMLKARALLASLNAEPPPD